MGGGALPRRQLCLFSLARVRVARRGYGQAPIVPTAMRTQLEGRGGSRPVVLGKDFSKAQVGSPAAAAEIAYWFDQLKMKTVGVWLRALGWWEEGVWCPATAPTVVVVVCVAV